MKNKKIPLEILAAYFSYKIQAKFRNSNNQEEKEYNKFVIGTINGLYENGDINCGDTVNSSPVSFKLILKPMEFLRNDFESFNSPIWVKDNIDLIEYAGVQKMIAKHYDVFGLIKQGLAIPKK